MRNSILTFNTARSVKTYEALITFALKRTYGDLGESTTKTFIVLKGTRLYITEVLQGSTPDDTNNSVQIIASNLSEQIEMELPVKLIEELLKNGAIIEKEFN